MQNKRILITGANGLVGKVLCTKLRHQASTIDSSAGCRVGSWCGIVWSPRCSAAAMWKFAGRYYQSTHIAWLGAACVGC